MSTSTEVAGLAEELLPAVPRSQPAPRPRKRRQRLHPATALLGLGLVAVTLVMGAAMVSLRADVVRLQHEISSQKLSCADFAHVRLRVRGHNARCVTR
jgi:hypothetical protein